jgi:hypothetical protein
LPAGCFRPPTEARPRRNRTALLRLAHSDSRTGRWAECSFHGKAGVCSQVGEAPGARPEQASRGRRRRRPQSRESGSERLCVARAPRHLDTTAVARARGPHASSSRLSGTFRGGWPTRPALSAGFIRTRYATRTRRMAREGTPTLARSARPSLPGDMGRWLRDVASAHVIETMTRREWSLGGRVSETAGA